MPEDAKLQNEENVKSPPISYVGDSVFARYQHGMIGLTLDHHENRVLIWLEPEVLESINKFAKEVF